MLKGGGEHLKCLVFDMSADDAHEDLPTEVELMRCQEKIQGLQAEEQRLRTATHQMRAELRRQRTETRIAGRLHQEFVSGHVATRPGGSELAASLPHLEKDPAIEDCTKPTHETTTDGNTEAPLVSGHGMNLEGNSRERGEVRRAQQLEVVARGLHDELRRRREVDSCSGVASEAASANFGRAGPSKQQVNNFCKRFALRSAVKLLSCCGVQKHVETMVVVVAVVDVVVVVAVAVVVVVVVVVDVGCTEHQIMMFAIMASVHQVSSGCFHVAVFFFDFMAIRAICSFVFF